MGQEKRAHIRCCNLTARRVVASSEKPENRRGAAEVRRDATANPDIKERQGQMKGESHVYSFGSHRIPPPLHPPPFPGRDVRDYFPAPDCPAPACQVVDSRVKFNSHDPPLPPWDTKFPDFPLSCTGRTSP
eukprot:Hpha_TRINITY_DN35900_c0_g1::TRINITY_DN35900_c0_g1_i1::g.184939::m.184939